MWRLSFSAERVTFQFRKWRAIVFRFCCVEEAASTARSRCSRSRSLSLSFASILLDVLSVPPATMEHESNSAGVSYIVFLLVQP